MLKLYGGADGIRTRDPLLAKQVLSRLSYSPFNFQRTQFTINMTGHRYPTHMFFDEIYRPVSDL